jgi:peptidoglycan hydrolase CwlO-like protein
MSISSIGSSGNTSAAALAQQLKADQKTLTEDQAKKASQDTLQADQAKVTADQQAITGAQDKTKTARPTGDGEAHAGKAHAGKGEAATVAPSVPSDGAGTSTSDTATGGIDITA